MNTQRILPIWGLIALIAMAVLISLLVQRRVDASSFDPSALRFPPASDGHWVVSPIEASQMLNSGAILIDGRGTPLKLRAPSPTGSISLLWQDLSRKAMPDKGLPLELDDAKKKLKTLGLNSEQPIVVVGDWKQGWGEDGRIVWTLRRWGFQRVVMVNGGLHALKEVGIPPLQVPSKSASVELKDISGLEVSLDEVKAKLSKPGVQFLDVREPREFEGKTPYGETRGGHLPGAKNIWFKLFLSDDGKLRTKEDIHQLLEKQGVRPEDEIIVYGSGGFRSGWVTAVLRDLGYQARNYAGSMWQWSEKSLFQYPLVATR